jgi:hypothetical protein
LVDTELKFIFTRMDIIQYLTALLQTRKAVGIVGLGTLYKKKIPGKYDADQHAFIPPSFVLAFSSELKEEEELVNYIVFNRNISKESADYYISEFAAKIQAQLADHQEADLMPIGRLKLADGEITFQAGGESILGHESFGLPSVTELDNGISTASVNETIIAEEVPSAIENQSEPLDEENIFPPIEEEKLANIEEENKLEEENPGQETADNHTVNATAEDELVYDEISDSSIAQISWNLKHNDPLVVETIEREVEPAPICTENRIEENYAEEEIPKKGIPFFMKILVVFLIIIAIGAIAYFINPSFFDRYIQQNHETNKETNLPVAAPSSSSPKPDSAPNDSLAKNNAMVTLAIDSVSVDSSDKITYEVLISAEDTEAKANLRIARLAKRGITAKKVRLSKTLINISAGSFLDLAKATKHRDSLRKIFKNPEIYIKSINPKNKK